MNIYIVETYHSIKNYPVFLRSPTPLKQRKQDFFGIIPIGNEDLLGILKSTTPHAYAAHCRMIELVRSMEVQQ